MKYILNSYRNLLNYFLKYFQTRPYVNSSLYSILTIQSIRDKALQLVSNEFSRSLDLIAVFIFLKSLDTRLRSLIRTETNSETKGQLEFLLNLLCKGGDPPIDQSSDNEQDNDDVNHSIDNEMFLQNFDFFSRKIKMSWSLI